MVDFWQTYFADSIMQFAGYNIVNTIVYFAILFLVAFFVIFPFLSRRGIKFDYSFVLALLPFVLLGSSARVLEDLHIFPRSANPLEFGFYTISPGIYIAVGAYAIFSLLFSLWLAKKLKKNFLLFFGTIGAISALPFLLFDISRITELAGFLATIALTIAISAVAWFGFRAWKPAIAKDNLNLLAIAAQALEGTSTYFATQFFYCGQAHMFSNIILGTVPWLFPILKVGLVSAIVFSLDTEIKGENLRGFIKLLLVVLGFAMGIRNLLTLGVGTCSAAGMAM